MLPNRPMFMMMIAINSIDSNSNRYIPNAKGIAKAMRKENSNSPNWYCSRLLGCRHKSEESLSFTLMCKQKQITDEHTNKRDSSTLLYIILWRINEGIKSIDEYVFSILDQNHLQHLKHNTKWTVCVENMNFLTRLMANYVPFFPSTPQPIGWLAILSDLHVWNELISKSISIRTN